MDRPISDIDLPELPDFLKPETSSTGRPLTPIQDIDLPEGAGVIMEEDKEGINILLFCFLNPYFTGSKHYS